MAARTDGALSIGYNSLRRYFPEDDGFTADLEEPPTASDKTPKRCFNII